MVNININGKDLTVRENCTILEAALINGFQIPALCYHEALGFYGACRICVVEIAAPRGQILVASCAYPVSEGLVIKTDSERVINARKLILELLLADCPDAEVIKVMAAQYGLTETRFPAEEKGKCILCGICVRACHNLIGAGAISLMKRGKNKVVSPPYESVTSACISCGTCETMCPTRAIDIKEFDRIKSLHEYEGRFHTQRCNICSKYHIDNEKPGSVNNWIEELQ
jgi:NADH dehydrogenase/NADH:ubiquinone oxidoreductase subunit G